MIVDSSILVAVVLVEPSAPAYFEKLTWAATINISAVSYAESSMVLLSRGGPRMVESLDRLLERLGARIVPLDHAQAILALEGFARFGKGRHPARLNLGDCFTYALAKHYGEPLLFQGEDFNKTDLLLA